MDMLFKIQILLSKVSFYLRFGSRIAGLLSLEAEDSNASLEALQRVGSSIAMHIVAAKPLFLSKEHVSSEAIESERDSLKTQVIN